MKPIFRFLTLAIIFSALAFWPSRALAAAPSNNPGDDKIVFGGTYFLLTGQQLDGNLAIFGGTASVEQNARVNGDVVLAGGTITINGEVTGNVSTFGGTLFLGSTALVHGNVNMLGATLHRDSGAKIEGTINNGSQGPFQLTVPPAANPAPLLINLHPITDTLWFMFRTLAISALAMLVVLFLPTPTNRVAEAIVSQPVLVGAMGLLTAIVGPILLVLLAITILLIPVSLLGIFILIVAGAFGWIAVGLEVGKRIAQLFKTQWPLAVAAGIGTFAMSLVVNGIGFIPCVGWIAPALVSLLGLGGIALTRFGIKPFPPTAPLYSNPVSSVQSYPVPPVPPAGGQFPPSDPMI